jgi:hypothetical protein
MGSHGPDVARPSRSRPRGSRARPWGRCRDARGRGRRGNDVEVRASWPRSTSIQRRGAQRPRPPAAPRTIPTSRRVGSGIRSMERRGIAISEPSTVDSPSPVARRVPSAVFPPEIAATGVRSTERPEASAAPAGFAVQTARWTSQIARDGHCADSGSPCPPPLLPTVDRRARQDRMIRSAPSLACGVAPKEPRGDLGLRMRLVSGR